MGAAIYVSKIELVFISLSARLMFILDSPLILLRSKINKDK